MIEAYRKFSEKTDIPLHVGVTEAGTERLGTIKSSIGIGTLISYTLPYSIGYCIVLILMLVVWMMIGAPIGPGAALFI